MLKKLIFTCTMGFLSFLSAEGEDSQDPSNFHKNRESYHILTFDGGGIRGAFTAQILAMLDEETNFLKDVDMFAGISTGSILAYGLAYGLTPKQLVDIYLKEAETIFTPYSAFSRVDFLQLNPKYQNLEFYKVVSKYIPSNVLVKDLPRKALSVSFKLYNTSEGNWGPEIIDNLEVGEENGDATTVIDAILRSAAAPTYFPSYQGRVDGGIASNNPSMVALSRAIDQRKGNKKIGKIFLLSLGTGTYHNGIMDEVYWGAFPWVMKGSNPPTPANPLLSAFMEGSSDLSHYECEQILGKKYFRLNTFLEKMIDMDDAKNVAYVVEAAKELPQKEPEKWKALVSWVKKSFKREPVN